MSQIGVASLLQIETSVFTNWSSYYKLGQLLQIVAKFITNWDRYNKLGAIIANSGIARGIDRPLLILYISVAKTQGFHSWIKTKPSFSNHSLNNDCLSLHIVLRYLS